MLQLRKSVLIVFAIMVISVMLAACGGSKAKEPIDSGTAGATLSTTVAPVSTAHSTQEPEPLTRVYKDDTGREVEIPTHPKQVVASYFIGEVLSLDVKPVGAASQFFLDSSFLKDRLIGVEQIGDNGGYDVEKILSLHPDIIIVNEYVKPEEVEQLSKVAPTVTVKYAGSDMLTHLNKVADILGKTAEAKLWTEKYQTKAAALKDQLTANGTQIETASVMQVMNKQLYVYFENIAYTVYQALGFSVPSKVKDMNKDNETGYAKLSLEVLPDYAADRIFVMQTYDEASDSFYKGVLDSALWKALPAVQNNKVYFLDNKWGGNDPISMDAQLDDVAKLLISK